MPKGETNRPVISGPMGPVKTSRGPDLVRSDNLTLVQGIKDCIEIPPPSTVAVRTMRRVSAGFRSQETPTASPTVADSAITASTPIQPSPTTSTSSGFLRKSSFPSLSSRFSRTSRSTQPLSSAASSRSGRGSALQAENVPPSKPASAQSPADLAQSLPQGGKLSKSKTMTVLHDLRRSISRQALVTRPRDLSPTADFSRPHYAPNFKPPPEALAIRAPDSPNRRPPRLSFSSAAPSSRPGTPETSPRQIVTAQPSQYWTGRFSALNDRFMSEEFASKALQATSPNHSVDASPMHQAKYLRPCRLSPVKTPSSLALATAQAGTDQQTSNEDERHLRVLAYLDFLCATPEARQSLREWQKTYARRFNRPILLPEGTSMEVEPERGLVARFFGGGRRPSAVPRSLVGQPRELPSSASIVRLRNTGRKPSPI